MQAMRIDAVGQRGHIPALRMLEVVWAHTAHSCSREGPCLATLSWMCGFGGPKAQPAYGWGPMGIGVHKAVALAPLGWGKEP